MESKNPKSKTLLPALMHFSESGGYMTIELEYLTIAVNMDPLATAAFLKNIGIVSWVEVEARELVVTFQATHFKERRMRYSEFVRLFFLPVLIRDWLIHSLHSKHTTNKQLIIHHLKTDICKP